MEAIYDTIGAGYNSTRQTDPYIASRLLHFINPKVNGVYLDIGCGTGNYTIALADRGLNLVGIEPAEEMLKVARSRDKEILWIQGIAEQISIDDESFAGAMATLTIHHWTDLAQGFKEIARVLKPGARFVLFTATAGQMEQYWLNHYFPQMLKTSIAQMPSFALIAECLASAGLKITDTEKYFVKDDLQDKFLYAGKNNPALYLDDAIRKGISSFSRLANAAEADAGLLKLAADLKTGEFNKIKDRYNNTSGDYLFIVAQKK